jgi:hypothetical protein
MRHAVIALGIATMLLTGTAQAKEYFKWVDKDGVTHFTVSPPKDIPAETVNTYAGSTSKYDPTEINAETEEAKKEKAQLAKDKQDEKTASSRMNEQCEMVKKQLQELKERDRVRMTDREGNERVLTPEEQKAKIDEFQNFVDKECSGKPKADAEVKK